MGTYNKTIAAGVSGALVTIIPAIIQPVWPEMWKALSTPGVQAALQTVITAAAVYFSPPNNAQ
jgi:predicted AlkP superfamily phosphohydrolase/phosphomutase